jgi:hypothetical protein
VWCWDHGGTNTILLDWFGEIGRVAVQLQDHVAGGVMNDGI